MVSDLKPGTIDVALVNMPFGPLVTPSLALSLIKPLLAEAGLSSIVLYENVEFAEFMGEANYHYISSGLPRAHDLVGEFIFSRSLFGKDAAPDSAYLEYLKRSFGDMRHQHYYAVSESLVSFLETNLSEVRRLADRFVEECAQRILRKAPRIVALTSAFQQNTASLAVAKRVKSLRPSVQIMMGGANCEGSMGAALFNQFEFLDCIVYGEAEPVVVNAIRYLLDELPEHPIGPAMFRGATGDKRSRVVVFDRMDSSPVPLFDDFFAAVNGRALPESPRLLYETSRGCWWGEKHHCTFCGLNGGTMAYRRKNPKVAIDQLTEISSKYPGMTICMTDNIMDNTYFKSFIPQIIEKQLSLDLFYEMKANLKREQLSNLSQAGIKRIQPGIESFSSKILKLMDKGITGLQNIQLLKWCREFGIYAAWNLLWGFPSEDPEEYSRMATIVDGLFHLQPPAGVGRLRIDRFSPYFKNADQHFENVRPFESYELVYPLPREVVREIAYFFDGEPCGRPNIHSYTRELLAKIMDWKQRSGIYLCYTDSNSIMTILDTRESKGSACAITALGGIEREVLLIGEEVTSVAAAVERLDRFPEHAIRSTIEALEKQRLLIVEEDNYLSLAVKMNAQYPDKTFWQTLRGNAKKTSDAILG